jgi:photosystem II stability/assembly factor-like uncharacterized protein
MPNDSELKTEFRAALEAVTPPAPWLAATVKEGLRARQTTRRRDQVRPELRIGFNAIAIVLLLAFAVAAFGVFMVLHQSTVPARHGAGLVIFATYMTSPTTGWAQVDPSELWRTSDGGSHWTEATPPSLPDREPDTGSYFLDGTHAWIVETGGSFPANYVVSFRTDDGGRNWHEGTPITALRSLSTLSPQVYFIDADRGWLLLETANNANSWSPTLYRTTDGGLHWELASNLAATLTEFGCGERMMFSTSSTGWLVFTCEQRPSLFVTHDGGATWHDQPLPAAPPSVKCQCQFLNPPTFFGQMNGIIVLSGSPGALFTTSDGGSTWTALSLPGEIQMDVSFGDASHGWAIAGSTAQLAKNPSSVAEPTLPLPLYHTDDGGATWAPVQTDLLLQSPDGRINQLYFVDKNNGFAVRVKSFGVSQFLKTTDGGRTWRVVETL